MNFRNLKVDAFWFYFTFYCQTAGLFLTRRNNENFLISCLPEKKDREMTLRSSRQQSPFPYVSLLSAQAIVGA